MTHNHKKAESPSYRERGDDAKLWTECLCHPRFICGAPNPQCDGIWRWALGRPVGHESRGFLTGLVPL